MTSDSLAVRLQEVQEAMRRAEQRAGRAPGAARLVAVSKRHPAEAVRALFDAGQLDFGENYVQEAQAKVDLLPAGLRWHFIGHLQTNKARQVAGRFALIHSLDSLRLAHSLHDCAERQAAVQDVLVQVNLGREIQKSGVMEDALPELAEYLSGCRHLRWQGLMLMPPFFDDPERARPYFARLRGLAEMLRSRYGLPLPELSMGMTGDFEAAVEEGATLVRVGTRIFGERS